MENRFKLILIIILIIFGLNYLSAYENGIEIKTDFQGVRVWVDGHYKGETKSHFSGMNVFRVENLVPGQHLIKCTYSGYNDYNKSVTIKSDEVITHKVVFLKTSVKVESIDGTEGQQQSQTGTIKVKSKPTGATVLFNSIEKGKADLVLLDVPVGEQTVKLYFDNARSKYLEISFELSVGSVITVTADFYNNTITHDAKYTVNFNSAPPGILYINGVKIGKCPKTKLLSYGNYNIKITNTKYLPYEVNINVNSNMFINESLKLESTYAYLMIKEDDEIGKEDVYINKVYYGQTPITSSKIVTGYKEIKIGNSSNYYDFEANQKYKIIPRNKIKLLQIPTSPKNLSSYQDLPEKPKLLKTKKKKHDLVALASFPILGFLLGGAITQNNEGAIAGLSFGFGVDIILYTLASAKDSKIVKNNMEKNKKRLDEWKTKCNRIENKNRDMLNEIVSRQKILNESISKKNISRGSWEFKELGNITDKEKLQIEK